MSSEHDGRLAVRELGPDEVHIRIRDFHDASDEHLWLMGADPAQSSSLTRAPGDEVGGPGQAVTRWVLDATALVP